MYAKTHTVSENAIARTRPAVWSLVVFGWVGALVLAQTSFRTGFEPEEGYVGNPSGVLLPGQQGWYQPDVGSDYRVYVFPGNVLGMKQGTQSGSQFIAGRDLQGGFLARAQHDQGLGGVNVWRISYDTAVLFEGTPPATQNLASFSLQPEPTTRSFVSLHRWTDIDNPTHCNCTYLVYDANGNPYPFPGRSAGPEWDNLHANDWYRIEAYVDFQQNRIIQVSITYVDWGMTFTRFPTDWYLRGGAAGQGLGLPSAFRFFTGGGTGMNIGGVDNVVVEPLIGAPCTGAEAIKKAKCKKGALKVVTKGANPGETVTATTQGACGTQTKSTNASGSGAAKFKFTGCAIGSGTVDVNWGCGGSASQNYACS